jgi:hypothetical protein
LALRLNEEIAVNPKLKMDCARCCGLCCVVPPFDADQGFGFDKPAHTICRNLAKDFRCSIHHELAIRGFPACAAFDCYGAGSWLTQAVFGGASWQSSPQIAQRMFTLYPRYRALHELMWLLELAIGQVAAADAAPLQCCLHDIETLCEGGADGVERVDVSALRWEVRIALRRHAYALSRNVAAGSFPP